MLMIIIIIIMIGEGDYHSDVVQSWLLLRITDDNRNFERPIPDNLSWFWYSWQKLIYCMSQDFDTCQFVIWFFWHLIFVNVTVLVSMCLSTNCPSFSKDTDISSFISDLSIVIWKGMATIKGCQQVLLPMFLSKKKVKEVFCHNCQRVTPSYFSPLRTWTGPWLLFRCAFFAIMRRCFLQNTQKHPRT